MPPPSSFIINDWPRQRALVMLRADFLKAFKVAIAANRDAICGATLSQGCSQSADMSIVSCIAVPGTN